MKAETPFQRAPLKTTMTKTSIKFRRCSVSNILLRVATTPRRTPASSTWSSESTMTTWSMTAMAIPTRPHARKAFLQPRKVPRTVVVMKEMAMPTSPPRPMNPM